MLISSNVLIVFVGVSILTIIFLILQFWSNYQKYSSLRSLPCPPTNWLLGNLPELLREAKKGKYFKTLNDWSKKLGSTYVIWNITKPIIIINKPKVIEKVLFEAAKENGNFVRSPKLNKLWGEHFGGEIIIKQDGSDWFWRRQAFNESFGATQISIYFEIVNKACNQVIATIENKLEKEKTILVDPIFTELTMKIIARLLLGIPLEGEISKKEGPPFETGKFYEAILILTSQFVAEAIGENKWVKYLPSPSGRKYWEARKYMKEIVEPRVDLALQLVGRDNQWTGSSIEVSPLFNESILVKLAKEERFTKDILCAEMIALIFAGTDTTGHTLSFAVGALALNPEIYKKAQDEVDRVCNSIGINLESIKQLTYIQGVIKEAMRLHPVSNGSPGCEAVKSTTIEGIHIPDGAEVGWSIMAAGRDPEEYPNPDQFEPHRWIKDKNTNSSPLTFLVFGSGPHRCLGEHLAIFEATLMLTLLLRHFDWKIPNGYNSIEKIAQNFMVFPEDRMPVEFIIRDFEE